MLINSVELGISVKKKNLNRIKADVDAIRYYLSNGLCRWDRDHTALDMIPGLFKLLLDLYVAKDCCLVPGRVDTRGGTTLDAVEDSLKNVRSTLCINKNPHKYISYLKFIFNEGFDKSKKLFFRGFF